MPESHQQSSRIGQSRIGQSRIGQSRIAVLATLLVLALAGGFAWYLANRDTDPVGPGGLGGPGGVGGQGGTNGEPTAVDATTLQLSVEAVAAAEDAEFERAIGLWKKLLDVLPDDQDLQLNQAVTVLKWIDETNNRLSSGLVEPAEQAVLTSELEKAYEEADGVVASLAALESNDPRFALLEAALWEVKARLLPYPEDQEVLKKAADILGESLARDPAQPLLACKYDDLVQQLGAQDDLMQKNADALLASWKSTPRNLYLLVRTGETMLGIQDPRVVELLEPSLEFAEPMLGMLARDVQRIDPPKLLADVQASIASDDWRKAQQLRRWFNLLKATSGFRPDWRQVEPDIMALLDVSFLTRFLQRVESPEAPPSALPTFSLSSIDRPANAAVWYDFDLDLDFDIALAAGSQVELLRLDGQAFEPAPSQTVDVGFEITGMMVADLFEVDSPARPRQSVAGLMLGAAEDGEPDTPRSGAPGRAAATDPAEPMDAEAISAANRHDTFQELIVWGKDGIKIIGLSAPVGTAEDSTPLLSLHAQATGLEAYRGVGCLTVSDIESDGDLDLILSTTDGIVVCQNNGNRTFQDATEFSQLDGVPDAITNLVACDFDADLDQDVLVVSPNATQVTLLENILHSQFRVKLLKDDSWPSGTGGIDARFTDFDGNASWDLVLGAEDELRLAMTQTPRPGQTAPTFSVDIAADARVVRPIDANNDGFVDVVSGGSGGLSLHLGSADPKLAQAEPISGVTEAIEAIDVLDSNNDGAVDLLVVADGRARVLLGEVGGGFVNARLRGINDINGGGRNNHFAVGSILELWGGNRRQRRIVERPSTHFGLGSMTPQNLRVVFSNGLTQNRERPSRNELIEERQELKGSCPFVYGWDGERFALITDLLWNAPLGLQVARGEVLHDRRWENLMLPGELMQPKDGYYELRVTEELWEVAYFDHLRLSAVDHPVDSRLFTNEKVGPPALATPRLFLTSDRVDARKATTSSGRDVVNQISSVDQQYAQAFERLICQGLAESHFIELDFGKLPVDKPLKLFLTGWMHPTDTSLNIGIAQNSSRPAPEPPSLWVVDEHGEWQCAQPFMGFPGGKPKSIVVDLAGAFLSDDHRVRIGSSQQIYWDEAFVAWDTEPAEAKIQDLEMESAQLRFRGFSQLLPRAMDQPHWYDYQSVNQAAKWPELEGPFTRFGDVQEIVGSDDDHLVIMTSGDEMIVRFKLPAQETPNGWRRDFVLHSVGWDKDADINTLAGQGSLPLPFASQTSYPPPPEQAEQSDQVWEQNAATLTRTKQIYGKPQSFGIQ